MAGDQLDRVAETMSVLALNDDDTIQAYGSRVMATAASSSQCCSIGVGDGARRVTRHASTCLPKNWNWSSVRTKIMTNST